MCLILFAYRVHPDFPLILAGNRDEFHDRPAAPADFWEEAPEVLAGRDLVGSGTWLGITRGGRFAAVSNFRRPSELLREGLSRGRLTVDFLRGDSSPAVYLETVAEKGSSYKGFNLLVADQSSFAYYSNREGVIRVLEPGIYGLSNALLDTPWPKVTKGKASLTALLAAGPPEADRLLDILADTARAPDEQLPDTGVGLERERLLSSSFIISPEYGTRASTVLLIDRTGTVDFIERTLDPSPDRWREVHRRFRLDI